MKKRRSLSIIFLCIILLLPYAVFAEDAEPVITETGEAAAATEEITATDEAASEDAPEIPDKSASDSYVTCYELIHERELYTDPGTVDTTRLPANPHIIYIEAGDLHNRIYPVAGGQGSVDPVQGVTYTSFAPDIFEVDNNGNLTIHKFSNDKVVYLEITIPQTGTTQGTVITVPLFIRKSEPFIVNSPQDLDLKSSDVHYQIDVTAAPGVELHYSKPDWQGYIVWDQTGLITILACGYGSISNSYGSPFAPEVYAEGSDKYYERHFTFTIHCEWDSYYKEQVITGPDTITGVHGTTQPLNINCNTRVGRYWSSNTSVATVSEDGIVTFVSPGSALIEAVIMQDTEYYCDVKRVKVVCTMTDEEIAAEKAARAAAEKKAKKLKAPSIKVTRGKRRNKVSWGKVKGADGYTLYVKYPGSKSYVQVVTKDATVKSVTHKGLTKGKKYSYKLRPYVLLTAR